jgi:hypothetical protein
MFMWKKGEYWTVRSWDKTLEKKKEKPMAGEKIKKDWVFGINHLILGGLKAML